MAGDRVQELVEEAQTWIQVGYNPPPSYKGRNGVEIMGDLLSIVEAVVVLETLIELSTKLQESRDLLNAQENGKIQA